MAFEVEIEFSKKAEEWKRQGNVEHFSIEANHMVDALYGLAHNFPARYAGDVCRISVVERQRKKIKTDRPDVIREGDGWKAREGRDIV